MYVMREKMFERGVMPRFAVRRKILIIRETENITN